MAGSPPSSKVLCKALIRCRSCSIEMRSHDSVNVSIRSYCSLTVICHTKIIYLAPISHFYEHRPMQVEVTRQEQCNNSMRPAINYDPSDGYRWTEKSPSSSSASIQKIICLHQNCVYHVNYQYSSNWRDVSQSICLLLFSVRKGAFYWSSKTKLRKKWKQVIGETTRRESVKWKKWAGIITFKLIDL